MTVFRQTGHSRNHVARPTFRVGLLLVIWTWANLMAAEVVHQSDFLVTSWHTENGLPDGNVTALEQTPDGYLWVGTFKGLARFDGVRFTVFSAGPAVLAERIAALAVDSKGKLWIGGESGALAWLENGQFHHAAPSGGPGEEKAPFAEERRASGGSTHSRQLNTLGLVEDASGAIWLQTRKPGLIRVKDGQCKVWTETNGLPPGRIFELVPDNERQPWLLAGDGLYRLSGTSWVKKAQSPGLGEAQPVLSPGRSGGLWLAEPKGSWMAGGQVVRLQQGRAPEELEQTPWVPDSPRSQVTALLEDDTGRLWLGMHWGGVFISVPRGHWQRLRSEGPLAQYRVNCLFEDRQGCVWVGTLGDGLYRITQRVVSTVHLPETANDHLINTVCAGPAGSVWIGTDGAGVFRLREGAMTHFGTEEGLDSTLIFSILADRRTNVWCGTSVGLFRLRDRRFEPVTGLVGQGSVLALFEDHAGSLWVGTPQGPVCLSEGEAKLNRLHSEPGTDEIRCFAEDQQGGIWVGTVGRGLFYLRSNRVEHVGPAEGLSTSDARSVWCDKQGRVWVGTLGAGLFRFQKGKFQALGAADGLPDETINGLIEDRQGILWATSYNGFFGCGLSMLSRYEAVRGPPLVCRWFSLADGLDYRTCSGSGQPVCSVDAESRIWFVNQRSVAVLDSRRLPAQLSQPELLLEEVNVDGITLKIVPGSPLRISSRMRHIEFHYTCPDLLTPGSPRFRYRLKGLEKEWMEAGPGRVAYYGHLPPRPYEFQVTSVGETGEWREPPRVLSLEIVPRFWERRTVQAIIALALLGGISVAVWGTARARLRRRLALLERQQALAQERARIARDMHDELGAGLTQISLLSSMAGATTAAAEEIRAGNNKIVEVSRELVRSLDEIVWVVRPQNDNLESLVEYLAQSSRDLCEHSTVRCWFSGPTQVPAVEVPANLRHNLVLACREALNNVLKHSGASEVRIRVLLQAATLTVEIADNGHGFDIARGEAKCSGLLHMRQRMNEAGGTCELESATGEGSRVRFILPLPVPSLGNGRK